MGKVRISASIDKKLKSRIEVRAKSQGRSFSSQMEWELLQTEKWELIQSK